jgi:hypothetical protein
MQEAVTSNTQICDGIREKLSELQEKLDRGCHMTDILDLRKTVTMEEEKVSPQLRRVVLAGLYLATRRKGFPADNLDIGTMQELISTRMRGYSTMSGPCKKSNLVTSGNQLVPVLLNATGV